MTANRPELLAGSRPQRAAGPGIIARVHAAAVRFDLHVPVSRSLKAKRAALRPIIDSLRHRFHVSVAEVDHQDLWQRAAIGVAVVAESHHHLEEVLDTVERFVRSAADVEVLETEVSYLNAEESCLPLEP